MENNNIFANLIEFLRFVLSIHGHCNIRRRIFALFSSGQKVRLQIKSKNPLFDTNPEHQWIKNLHAEGKATRAFNILTECTDEIPRILEYLLEGAQFDYNIQKPTTDYDETIIFFFPCKYLNYSLFSILRNPCFV